MSDRGLQVGPIPRDKPEPPAASLPAWSDACIVGVMVGAAVVFNFVILPMVRVAGESRAEPAIIFFVSLAIGVYAAELAILTLGLVWGPGSFLRRLLVHWAIVFGLYVAWALGFAAGFGSQTRATELPQIWGTMLCVLPLVSLAAQLPLWPLRIYFGWRIERQPVAPGPNAHSPLLIRDLMAGTVITSVSLASLRLMPAEARGDGNMLWIGGAIAFASVLGISVFSLLPASLFLLRLHSAAAAAGAWFGYTAVALVATLVVVSSLMGSGPPGEALAAFLVVFYSFAGALSLPLFIARARGYRLRFPRDSAATAFVISQEVPHDHA